MTQNHSKALAAIGSLALLFTAACSQDASAPADMSTQEKTTQTVAGVVGSDGDLSTLARALKDTGLAAMLDEQASYTVLAPTDDAFAALGEDGKALTDEANSAVLAAVLREHLVPGALTPEAVEQAVADKGGPVTMRTFGEGSVTFSVDNGVLTVTGADGAKAALASGALAGSNGVVIPLDAVIATPSKDG